MFAQPTKKYIKCLVSAAPVLTLVGRRTIMQRCWIRVLLAVSLILSAAVTVPLDARARGNVAAGRDGQTLTEFVGKINQNGPDFTLIGYLTRIKGLDEASLFAGGDAAARSEKLARFPVKAETTLTSRNTVDNLFNVDAKGKLNVFFDETPSSDFSIPGSFSAGTLIATFNITVQNVINVIAPAQGVYTTWGVLEQTSAKQFRLGGKRFRFGHKNQSVRIVATGQGTLLDADIPISVHSIIGNTISLE